MDVKREVILKLQQFIIERGNTDKRGQYKKKSEELDLSLTQFHIIELIDNNDKANSKFLSEMLNVSKLAITKSIKELLAEDLVVESHNEFNEKEVNYSLTQKGKKLSYMHDKLHEKSVKKYEEVLKVFDDDETAVIMEFLDRSIGELKKEDGLND